jgi:hypothetical protein
MSYIATVTEKVPHWEKRALPSGHLLQRDSQESEATGWIQLINNETLFSLRGG